MTANTRPYSCTNKSVYWFGRCDRKSIENEAQDHSSKYFSDSPSLELEETTARRFASIRKSLHRLNCNCGGIKSVRRVFTTEAQARLAASTLLGHNYHLIDSAFVNDGEEFAMTIDQYKRLCNKSAIRSFKLYRCPLQLESSIATTGTRPLPVDPYFLGLWLGDGTVGRAEISSSDPEIGVWLESYVERLNRSMHKLHLTKVLNHKAGTRMANGYVTNIDAFRYRISCQAKWRGQYNHVLTGLRELGILNDKTDGIPCSYMTADEDTRLAVIAGLIDSDGTYRKSENGYRFVQTTKEHKKMVYDLKELSCSCGISVSGVGVEMRTSPFTGENYEAYVCHLGKGSIKFQKHLLLPRKKMNLEWRYVNHDTRTFTISEGQSGEYRAIKVSGGKFQLADRVVVCN
ncbi:hypothetical protein POJ06DRAFT_100418 [Lipomyces tetrasporus]|uniref:DOD-type homing endonuclease domain-containing protein n=1 Tax=Lipomyces tetrasporus TaxID=54092 RepID=A0AAD7QRM8_9ASCO|nr:uncharacterized protein POJ06DRAFT_100418 [Lipomyces tetrasporus]KAJ8100264.1 hypothetical protein POJ06DRAFT_100418 [Lipomyces tetrasporus]